MREISIENYLTKRVKEHGGFVRKVKWPNHRGAPDRLVGFPDRLEHFLVELKAPGKKLEAHQRREIERLCGIGFSVWVVDSLVMVESFIYAALKNRK